MVAADDSAWTVPVSVIGLPDRGLRRSIDAGESERGAIARRAGLRGLSALNGAFELTPAPQGQVRVQGRVTAEVEQACVVTLEGVHTSVDELVDLTFAPPELAAELAAAIDPDSAEVTSDPPEAFVDGTVDLAKITVEFLILGLDPYPRKPGAVFEPILAPEDPADHPFAALSALKEDEGTPPRGKPGQKKPN